MFKSSTIIDNKSAEFKNMKQTQMELFGNSQAKRKRIDYLVFRNILLRKHQLDWNLIKILPIKQLLETHCEGGVLHYKTQGKTFAHERYRQW